MNILPTGKSNLFNSNLNDWKNKFVSAYVNDAMNKIAQCENCECHPDEGSKPVPKKKKIDKPLNKVIKEGEEPDISIASKNRKLVSNRNFVSTSSLKKTISMMDEATKEKLIAYFTEFYGEELTKALVKDYF